MKLLWPKEKERRIMNIIILNLNIERGTIISKHNESERKINIGPGNLITKGARKRSGKILKFCDLLTRDEKTENVQE